MMKPVDYVNVVVLPTVREHFLSKTDQRFGMLACIATFHISDHVALADGRHVGLVFDDVRARCEAQFEIVRGVCNGTKHGKTDAKVTRQHQHRAGDEVVVPGFAWGASGRGWGQAAWGGAALGVEHNGQLWTFGQCIGAVLAAFGDLYPHHFPDGALGIDVIMAVSMPAR